MKKAWVILLGSAALVTALVCLGGVRFARQSEEPVLTQQWKGIVLAKTSRELVLQPAERTSAETRTVRIVAGAQSAAAADIVDGKANVAVYFSETVQVGDLVQIETELHSDNTETLRALQVLVTGAAPQQDAQTAAGKETTGAQDGAQSEAAPVQTEPAQPEKAPS